MSSEFHSWPATRTGLRTTVLLIDDDALRSHTRMDALKQEFPAVQRATSAAEAFILLEEREFAGSIAVAVVALRRAGMSKPEFVRELATRLRGRAIVVLGGPAELERDYSGAHIHFLPMGTPMQEMQRAVQMALGEGLRKAA